MSPALDVTTRSTAAKLVGSATAAKVAKPKAEERAATRTPATALPGPAAPTRSMRGADRRLRLSGKELEMLTHGLETQLDAGVPLIRALQTQGEQAENKRVMRVCATLLEQIGGGSSFSEALDSLPNVFNTVYRNLIRAGDASGNLPTVMHDLGAYLEWTGRIKSTIRQAAVYPVMLVTVSIGVVMFILGFVFPKFGDLLKKMLTSLDAQTLFLLRAGDFVHDHWQGIVMALLGCVAAMVLFFRLPMGQALVFKVLSRTPLFGPVFHALDLTRLLRNVSILVSAGIPVLESIRLAREALSIPSLRTEVGRVHDDLMAGETLTQAFAKAKVVPQLVVNMVAVGEESGRLATVLGKVGEHYEQVSKERVAKMIAAMGPLITLVLGVVVGFIIVTILKTLYTAILHVGK